MKVIKGTTKKGENMIKNASYYAGYNLSDVYGKFSKEKERAWEYCLNKCYEEKGKNFHIYAFNTCQFCVAWEVVEGVRIETAYNSYLVTI